jgi:hypothetical protein
MTRCRATKRNAVRSSSSSATLQKVANEYQRVPSHVIGMHELATFMRANQASQSHWITTFPGADTWRDLHLGLGMIDLNPDPADPNRDTFSDDQDMDWLTLVWSGANIMAHQVVGATRNSQKDSYDFSSLLVSTWRLLLRNWPFSANSGVEKMTPTEKHRKPPPLPTYHTYSSSSPSRPWSDHCSPLPSWIAGLLGERFTASSYSSTAPPLQRDERRLQSRDENEIENIK